MLVHVDDRHDLVTQFTIAFWARYCSLMYARPAAHSNACQKILMYLLTNAKVLVSLWRGRLYYYSSATVFDLVTQDLVQWLEEDPGRVKLLKRLEDKHGLFAVLGEAIFNFIKKKTDPFPRALRSRVDFRMVKNWKRGLVFVFMFRHVLRLHVTSQWHKYPPKELKRNMRLFSRYLEKDVVIIRSSPSFLKLKRTDPAAKKNKGKRSSTGLTTETESPKKVFKVDLSKSTTESESSSWEEEA